LKGFAFVLLKPLASSNAYLYSLILETLGLHANIVAFRNFQSTFEQTSLHYLESETQPRYPVISRYLANKLLAGFIVEQKFNNAKSDKWVRNMRTEVIGPSNPAECQTGQIRYLAIQHQINYLIKLNESELPDYQTINGHRQCLDNLIHFSGSRIEAVREIGIWYGNNFLEYSIYQEKVMSDM
jgi:nucleoside diphosphate kinase